MEIAGKFKASRALLKWHQYTGITSTKVAGEKKKTNECSKCRLCKTDRYHCTYTTPRFNHIIKCFYVFTVPEKKLKMLIFISKTIKL